MYNFIGDDIGFKSNTLYERHQYLQINSFRGQMYSKLINTPQKSKEKNKNNLFFLFSNN